jgi:hypothetical protein
MRQSAAPVLLLRALGSLYRRRCSIVRQCCTTHDRRPVVQHNLEQEPSGEVVAVNARGTRTGQRQLQSGVKTYERNLNLEACLAAGRAGQNPFRSREKAEKRVLFGERYLPASRRDARQERRKRAFKKGKKCDILCHF